MQTWISFVSTTKKKSLRNSSPKNDNLLKIYSPSGHPKCWWVCFFIRSDLEKCSIASLAHQWILCSEWVPSEWVQTADKNITIIHTAPSITILWNQKLHFCKNQIHQDISTSNSRFQSYMCDIAFSSDKVISSESGEKSAQIKHCLQPKEF